MSVSDPTPAVALCGAGADWRPAVPERTVAVLMSGGVDSSVSALRLRREGWDVLGVTMRLPLAAGCTPRVAATADAERVATGLGVPLLIVDVCAAFLRRVLEPFRDAYRAGRTPNPCVVCNAGLKFGLVWDLVEARFGVRRLATGHYARVLATQDGVRLAQAAQRERDQSYFLFRLPPRRLADLLLPVGACGKPQVRAEAAAAGLPVAATPDSMDTCFSGADDYRAALGPLAPRPGPIVDSAGKTLGRHDGVWNYTVGQRRGLGVAAQEPLYVLAIEAGRDAVVVGPRHEACARRVRAVTPAQLVPVAPAPGARLFGKIRSYTPAVPCRLDRWDATGMEVSFDEPQFAPAPGQALVLYDDAGQVLGGGDITTGAEHPVPHA